MTFPDNEIESSAARFDQHSQMRVALDVLSHKWTPMILWLLREGALRFTELRSQLPGITAQVLSQSLRSLERDGLLVRIDHHEQPPCVEYALTPLGRTLCGPAEAVRAWADRHVPAVLDARRRYRSAAAASVPTAPPAPTSDDAPSGSRTPHRRLP